MSVLTFPKVEANQPNELGQTKKIILQHVGSPFDTSGRLVFTFKINDCRKLQLSLYPWAINQNGDFGKITDERKFWGTWFNYTFYSVGLYELMAEFGVTLVNGSEDERLLLALIKDSGDICLLTDVREYLHLLHEVIKTRNPATRDKFLSIKTAKINRLLQLSREIK